SNGLENYPRAQALYNYESDVAGDLSFRKGDVMYVTDKGEAESSDEPAWWTGVIGDRQGLFPSTYVKLLDDRPIPAQPNEPSEGDILIAKYDYQDGRQEELSFQIGDKIVLMEKDSTGWWLGKLVKTGVVGWFVPDLTTPFAPNVIPDDDFKSDQDEGELDQPSLDIDSNDNIGQFDDSTSDVLAQTKSPTAVSSSLTTSTATTKSAHAPVKTTTSATTSTTNTTAAGDNQKQDIIISYEDLKNKKFDDSINKQKLEVYLSDTEFQKVFGCTRADFAEMPLWKQRQRKKAVDLF
ncbi:intersectin-like protein, partial [Reticulomyxa filosa]